MPEDAPVLVDFVLAASEGLAEVVWREMAGPGEDPRRVGLERQTAKTRTDEIWVVDNGGGAIAGLTGYPIPDCVAGPERDTPAMFRPLNELEALAAGTWYVNVLATDPRHRGRGLGSELLALAEHRALGAGCGGLSIIVADNNIRARRLYERLGYLEEARRPMVKEGWQGPGRDWVLLVRRF